MAAAESTPEGAGAPASSAVGWLSKDEVNALYYNTVAGEIAFATEASAGPHPVAVAKLIALQARALGKRSIRVVEIAANDCTFQRALLSELRSLASSGFTDLDRIDYVAVEYARASLEAAAEWESENGTHDRVLRPSSSRPDGTPTLVALCLSEGPPTLNLGLIHAEATSFVGSTTERFDFAILNELLDDLPYRAYYADEDGTGHEAVAQSRLDEDGWTVRIVSSDPPDGAPRDLEAGSLTARSAESVAVVGGLAERLNPGGMLLVHDYGFADENPPLSEWAALPPSVPPFVTMEFPVESDRPFPRSFYRVFGNDRHRVVQVTNDVNFAELAAVLEPHGSVTVLAHGNAIANRAGGPLPAAGDGVFLSEFGPLRPDTDLAALLDRLHQGQRALRLAYGRDHVAGHVSLFYDLLFVKAGG